MLIIVVLIIHLDLIEIIINNIILTCYDILKYINEYLLYLIFFRIIINFYKNFL